MPLIDVGGVRLNYEERGSGPAVLFLSGTGARGRTWHLHQVPALVQAGYRVVTFDTRGIAPSDTPPVVTMPDLIADAAGLIERLGLGPCRVAGSSMGARVAAELCLQRPDLVDRVVLMATFGRPGAFLDAMTAGERALRESGTKLPAEYLGVVRAALNLSPRTLADDRAARDWLDVFELPLAGETDGAASRLDADADADRLMAYAQISVPCLVLGFADDLIAPARGNRDVAAAVPGARYAEIPDAGHYGYLEQPSLVNTELIAFLSEGQS
ncbi:hydrolase [Actinoplanes cyaneus]|uniref:Hydrolase n=1 Tax=Actinoplanes cyaneus TaxID=52696 RepID=A0A919IH21_9ACTN|nr:alpha/beta hydrolase [Actinoplanes cyaneus]MCW2142552.1 Pimeloyl-ACP methyl ester carboxylesterase [Actinoplanes cyaneus]GID65358.1 hydrolase [Actinoplanes cyaneus]